MSGVSWGTIYYFVAFLQFSLPPPLPPFPPLLASFCNTGAVSLDVTVN